MGNTSSGGAVSATTNKNESKNGTPPSKKKNEKTKDESTKSYRRSIRRSKRARSFSRTVDSREIVTSRACERPRVLSGTLWEDPCFPREMAMEGSRMENVQYRWMRPKQFCEKPTLVGTKPSRHDVLQGLIGNCWMMATLAGIADELPRLRQVLAGVDYDPASSGYDGVFRCRFWHYGQWVDVFVDDCLPVRPDHSAPRGFGLLGAHSPDPNVLWVALVEKALAKFHGSYKSIEAREREYGWRLLTGGVPCILDQDKIRRLPTDDLFNRIKLALEAGCIVTCSHRIEGGLHAYTVTGAAHHSSKGNVIRVRNPWGEERGRLSWLESSERWGYGPGEDKAAFACQQGELWVLRGECYRNFQQFCIGSFQADFYDETQKKHTRLEHLYTFYGEWTGETAGGKLRAEIFNNPKYRVNIRGSKSKKKKIIFELIPRPIESNKGVSLYLYKITRLKPYKATLCRNTHKEGEVPVFLANGCPQYTHELSPGAYMAVPVLQNRGEEKEFCLRVYGNKRTVECREISGTFFHLSEENEADESLRWQNHVGLWKGDNFANEQTRPSLIDKLTQFHLKVTGQTKVSFRLLQEFSQSSVMKLEIYKTTESVSRAIDHKFLETQTPVQRLNIQGSEYSVVHTLEPDCTYIVLVYSWSTTQNVHFTLSLGWPEEARVHIKSYNVS